MPYFIINRKYHINMADKPTIAGTTVLHTRGLGAAGVVDAGVDALSAIASLNSEVFDGVDSDRR